MISRLRTLWRKAVHVAGVIQKQLGLGDLKLSWVPVTPDTRIQAVVRGTVDLECGSALYDRWFGAFGKPNPALQAMYFLNGLPE